MAESLDPARSARRAGAAVAACALAGGAFALNRALVGVFYDDGLYAGLAIALGRGWGYVHPHLPGTPGAIHYPPLYPLVLAPLFATLSVSAAAFTAKLLNLGLAAGGAGLIAWHATRRNLLGEQAPRWLAAVVVGAAAVAIPVLAVQSVLFAEPLFGTLLALAVILADEPPVAGPGRQTALLAGLAAALALLTRAIGVASGAGVALYLIAVRRAPVKRALVALAPVALAAVGWGAWILDHRSGIDPAIAVNYGSYLEILKQAGLGALGGNARDLPRPVMFLALGWLWPGSKALYYVFSAAALAVGLFGLALVARRSAIGFTLWCYLAILAVWPFPPDRFLWGVLPWLAVAWTAGAVALWRRARFRIAVGLVAGAVAFGYARYEGRGFAGRWWGSAAREISASFSSLLPSLSALPPDAVLATDDEALVWLYTGRTTVPFYIYEYRGREIAEPSPAQHRAYLERQGVTHVLLSGPRSDSARELDALLGAYPGWLAIVRGWPDGRAILRVNRGR